MMKALAVTLLSYTLAVHLIAKFSPIPFIGWAAALIGFPLALRLTVKQLFLIELTGILFSYAIQADSLAEFYAQGYSFLGFSHQMGMANFYIVLWVILIPIVALSMSALSAIGMKFFSRFTPERIRYVVEGR